MCFFNFSLKLVFILIPISVRLSISQNDYLYLQGTYVSKTKYTKPISGGKNSIFTCAAKCLYDVACGSFSFDNEECSLNWKDEKKIENDEIFEEKERVSFFKFIHVKNNTIKLRLRR